MNGPWCGGVQCHWLKVEFVRVLLGPAEFAAVVGEHGFHWQVQLAVEGQHIIVQNRHRRFGLLGDVEKAEGVAAVGVHHRVQVDLAHPLERADEEGVGGQELARSA